MNFLLATLFVVALGASADCGWKLKGNDCICMNSADGSLLRDWTDTCCKAMGATIGGVVGFVVTILGPVDGP
jgi:hypothetical protein